MTDHTIQSVGVDYFVATTKKDEVGERWYERFVKHTDESGGKLDPVKDWQNRWYKGRSCAKVYWGQSQTMGYIVMAQGAIANDLWVDLVPKTSYNVTRVDLQVTCKLERPKPDWASVVYERASANNSRSSTLVQSSRGGSTCYIGSRHSDQFGRIYDKGVQSRQAEPGIMWRYECQIMKPRALPLTKSMYESITKAGADQASEIQGYVYRWFNARSITTLFTERPSRLVAEVGKSVSTADKKLIWLRSQVQPTVRNLIAAGHLKDTIDALGVSYDQLYLLAGAEGVLVTEDRRDGGLTNV